MYKCKKWTFKYLWNILGESFTFVLTPKTLACYKTAFENENEKLFNISLEKLKLQDCDENAKKLVIANHADPDYNGLELLCNSADEYTSWMESFSKALNNDKNVSLDF